MVDEKILTDFPESLQEIHNPPKKLFYRGDLTLLEKPCISIVGTRRMSEYGRYMTEKIVGELSCADLVIVSGLAKGIDSIAHQAALDNSMKTIAVLGSGLSCIYPRENAALADEIGKHGLLLSEYEGDREPLNHHFPQRNRLVSAISLATLVIEAPVRSGALITARFALEQNRGIFVVPGDVDRENSLGILELMQKGAAHPVSSGYEILEILKQQPTLISEPETIDLKLSTSENLIYKILSPSRPKALQTIIQEAHLPAEETLAILSLLEIRDIISQKQGCFKIKSHS